MYARRDAPATANEPRVREGKPMTQFDQVLQEVDGLCRKRHIPMLGREKAEFLTDLIEQEKPSLIVECGTAIGYSGLWIASRLQAMGLLTPNV